MYYVQCMRDSVCECYCEKHTYILIWKQTFDPQNQYLIKDKNWNLAGPPYLSSIIVAKSTTNHTLGFKKKHPLAKASSAAGPSYGWPRPTKTWIGNQFIKF